MKVGKSRIGRLVTSSEILFFFFFSFFVFLFYLVDLRWSCSGSQYFAFLPLFFLSFFPLDGGGGGGDGGMAYGTVICKRLIDILIMGAF